MDHDFFLKQFSAGVFKETLTNLTSGGEATALLCFLEDYGEEKPNQYFCTTGACHAVIKHHDRRTKTALTVNAINPAFAPQRGAELFYTWLATDSPFRAAFPFKDGKLMREQLGVPVTTLCDGEVFLATSQLARLSTGEYRAHFKAFLLYLGENPTVNIMLTLILFLYGGASVSTDGRLVISKVYRINSTLHLPFSSTHTIGGLKQLCTTEEVFPAVSRGSFKEAGYYGASNQLLKSGWGDDGYPQAGWADCFYSESPTYVSLQDTGEAAYKDPWPAATAAFVKGKLPTTTGLNTANLIKPW